MRAGKTTINPPKVIPNNTLDAYKQYTFAAKRIRNGLICNKYKFSCDTLKLNNGNFRDLKIYIYNQWYA